MKSPTIVILWIAAAAALPANEKNAAVAHWAKTLPMLQTDEVTKVQDFKSKDSKYRNEILEANWETALIKLGELKYRTQTVTELIKPEAEKDSHYGLLVSESFSNSTAKANEIYFEMADKILNQTLTANETQEYFHLLQRVYDKPMNYILPLLYENEPVGLTVSTIFQLGSFLLQEYRTQIYYFINL